MSFSLLYKTFVKLALIIKLSPIVTSTLFSVWNRWDEPTTSLIFDTDIFIRFEVSVAIIRRELSLGLSFRDWTLKKGHHYNLVDSYFKQILLSLLMIFIIILIIDQMWMSVLKEKEYVTQTHKDVWTH